MLTESQRQDFFNKLKEIAKVYSNRAELLENGLEKTVLSELATEINWLCNNITDTFEVHSSSEHVDILNINDDVPGFMNYLLLFSKHATKNFKYIISFLHAVDYCSFSKINNLPANALSEILFIDTVSSHFSVNGLRATDNNNLQQIINDSLTFEPLGIAYLTPELKKILQDTAIDPKNADNVKDWGLLFDFQKPHNYTLTLCKQIEIALEYAYDEKVRDFIKERMDDPSVGIKKTFFKFQKTLEDQSISQELRTHLEHTVKRCAEVIEKTRDYQKVAISEISRLFQGNTIKQHDAQAIAFLTFKKLKKDGKLNGIENIDITEIERSFTGENIDKQFIKDIFSKVQKRAADEKTDSTVEKVILTIEEFLLTLWYAIKLYLFRSKDEAKDIKKTSDWSSFVAESRSNDIPPQLPRVI